MSVCLFPLGVFTFSERDIFDINELTDDKQFFPDVGGFIKSSFESMQNK